MSEVTKEEKTGERKQVWTAKQNCRKRWGCHGTGIIGKDVTTGKEIVCRCVQLIWVEPVDGQLTNREYVQPKEVWPEHREMYELRHNLKLETTDGGS